MPRPSAGPSLEGDTWPVPGGLMLSMPESGWGGVPRAGAGAGAGSSTLSTLSYSSSSSTSVTCSHDVIVTCELLTC